MTSWLQRHLDYPRPRDRLNEHLVCLLAHATQPLAPASAGALRSLDTAEFHSWAARSLACSDCLSELAASGAVHPLGFVKLVLKTGSSGERVRLHLWPISLKFETANHPHDHYWSFSSLILAGSMTSTFYEVASVDGPGEQHHEWRLAQFRSNPQRGAPYTFVNGGRATLHPCRVQTLNTGDIYSMRVGEIHKAERLGIVPTASLVLQGPQESTATRTFHPESGFDFTYPGTTEIPLTARMVRLILTDFLA
jgi:hypothetical protein